MKKYIGPAIAVAAVILVVLAVVFFVRYNMPEGEIKGSIIKHPETGIEYIECKALSPCHPKTDKKPETDEDVYMYVNRSDWVQYFYEVHNEDPKNFLCFEYKGYYYLVRNKEIKEPTLSEFNAIAAEIFNEGDTLQIDAFYADRDLIPDEYLPEESSGNSTEGETYLCKKITDALVNYPLDSLPQDESAVGEDIYNIHLLSAKYPGLYYNIRFFKLGKEYYLYDIGTNTYAVCPNEIVLEMVGNGQ